MKIAEREQSDTFVELVYDPAMLRFNADPLADCPAVDPPRDAIAKTVAGDEFLPHQVCAGLLNVDEIEHELSARGERSGDVAQNSEVVRQVVEIAEAGEQAEHPVVVAASERIAHVLLQPAHGGAGTPPGEREALAGKIEAGDAEAAGRQVRRVPAITAPEIEHCGIVWRLQPGNQPIDERARFPFVTVRIQALIMR